MPKNNLQSIIKFFQTDIWRVTPDEVSPLTFLLLEIAKKLLLAMPQQFDYAKIREISQYNQNNIRVMVYRWIQDGLVKKIKNGKNIIFERI